MKILIADMPSLGCEALQETLQKMNVEILIPKKDLFTYLEMQVKIRRQEIDLLVIPRGTNPRLRINLQKAGDKHQISYIISPNINVLKQFINELRQKS